MKSNIKYWLFIAFLFTSLLTFGQGEMIIDHRTNDTLKCDVLRVEPRRKFIVYKTDDETTTRIFFESFHSVYFNGRWYGKLNDDE